MLRIRTISTTDPLYKQECDLRESVLLRAVGLDMATFREKYAGVENSATHFVAVADHPTGPKVVGTALLIPSDGERAKLMQMAVDPQRQHEGIGRMLVSTLESRAFGEMGVRELYCHAQASAVGFYEKLGWVAEGERFMEAGIPHLRMALRGPGPADEQTSQ